MSTYRVTWGIDVEANSPQGAALKAEAHAQRVGTTATVFRAKRSGYKDTVVDTDKFWQRRFGDVVTAVYNGNEACYSLGRNGDIRTYGLEVLNLGTSVLLTPLRRHGERGRCCIEVSKSAIPAVVDALRDYYRQEKT